MVRALAALTLFAVGLLWQRSRAVRIFRKRLIRQGLPEDVAARFAHDYRTLFRLPHLSRLGRPTQNKAD
ncbi:hypothetical protein H5T53_06890 [Candidatus Bipolaricaulota bacterium]|nr:hypothetical protein [Candidatus Bipolaricaulota bacterium]